MVPGWTTLALRPRRRSCLPTGRVDETLGIAAEALYELLAAGVRLGRDLDDGGAEPQPRAGREVRLAQVQVHVEFVAGQGPAGPLLRHQGDDPGVHDVELHL